jgi:serine/threonine protein phosphatase PrpC
MARDILKYQHPGRRDEQQDAARVFSDPASGCIMALIADGAGGHSGGQLASRTACRPFEETFATVQHPVSDPEIFMKEVARKGHEAVRAVGEKLGISPRTTLAVLYLDGQRAHCLHSGDSRIYLFRNGSILRRTIDHSVAQLLLVCGKITEAEMGKHPDQGKLTQCLGGETYAEPEYFCETVGEGDTFLLCSDGVWEHFTAVEMAKIQDYALNQGEAAAAKIAMACLDRGGAKADNLSLISIGPESARTKKYRPREWLIAAVLLLLGCATGYFITRL